MGLFASQTAFKLVSVTMSAPPQLAKLISLKPSNTILMFPLQSGATPLIVSIGVFGHVPLSGRWPQGPKKRASGL
ncbi:hypothetical protein EBZ80_19550 [bacterium]|nr:hypothetical protein [bacterium]